MTSALFTLVSRRPIPEALIAHVRATVPHAVETTGITHALFTAAWRFDTEDPESMRIELRTPATALNVDSALILNDLADKGPALIVTDIDSTLIEQEVIVELAAEAGVAEEVSAITGAAMRGEIDFVESLTRRVATLKGLSDSIFNTVRARLTLQNGTREFISAARTRGIPVRAVSGGFHEVFDPVASKLGLDAVILNHLEVIDGHLTGRLSGPIISPEAKASALREWAATDGIPLERTVAIGDGANDLHMIAAAGLGVSYMGKDRVLAEAKAAITFPRLTAVGALLGWSDGDAPIIPEE